jgi:hypothetical protein
MNTAAVIVLILLVVVLPAAIVGALFVWAAIKDGQKGQGGAGAPRHPAEDAPRPLSDAPRV